MLAKAHAQVIANIQKNVCCSLAIVDQFGDKSLVFNALREIGCQIPLEQRPRAEDDIAVAAASIIARAEFLSKLQQLSQDVGMQLPKGGSAATIITVGRAIVAKYGEAGLDKVAKRHFKITQTILQ